MTQIPAVPSHDLDADALATPPVESVDRALRILLELASAGPKGVALAELAAATGLNKASVHRSLAALKHRAFATQDPITGRYLLGGAAAQLGVSFYGSDNLEGLLHGALVELSARVGELVHLGVLDGTHVVYLDKVEPDRSVRVFSSVGARVPAVRTAMGRAMLSSMGLERASLDAFLGEGDEPEHVWSELQGAPGRGYAREIEENEKGITCVALPVARGARVVGAVSVTVPAARMTAKRMAEIAAEIHAALGRALPEGMSAGWPRR